MRLTKKAAILKILMVLSGVFCFADIHSAYEEAVRVYTEYRKVRSAEQILNLDSIREDLLITDKSEDDYVVTGIDKTNNSYYLKVEETIIGELSGDQIEKSSVAKRTDIVWMREVDGRFYIQGDPMLEHICIRESDFREMYGNPG